MIIFLGETSSASSCSVNGDLEPGRFQAIGIESSPRKPDNLKIPISRLQISPMSSFKVTATFVDETPLYDFGRN